jgi:hypothetical protein
MTNRIDLLIKNEMMKSNHIYKFCLLIISFLMLQNLSFAQEEEAEYDGFITKLAFSYTKNTDGIRTLSCVITAKKGDINQPLENAELKFYAGDDISLGSKTSNRNGFASIVIDDKIKLPVDDSGAVLYRVDYKGVENSKDASSEISVVDIKLDLKLEEVDSVKTITVTASKLGKDNEEIAIKGQDVMIYVKRLYSDLKIGEVYLDDEEGIGSTEFKTIPGDSAGNILIIARIEGHELYATVEKSQSINWGSIVSYDVSKHKRELWTNEAPLWMAITLSVFILGVFYHLIRVFIKMYKIKKIGQDFEKLPITK